MAKDKVRHVGASGCDVPMEADAQGALIVPKWDAGCLQITVDTPPEQWPTSLVIGSNKWQAAVVNSACTPDLQIGPEWSEPFTVTDWLVMVREGVDEKTGEIKRYPWLSLLCADGSIVGTSSEVVPHQLARILRAYSPEQWAKGIKVKLRRRPSRNGLTSYHELRVVE